MRLSVDHPVRARGQSGFTLVEVMVAMTLLLTAVLGLMSMTDSAANSTTTTKAREGAVSLAREVLEDAGGIAYSQLGPSSLVPTLQALPGLASQSGGTWTVTRRDTSSAGFTYTIDATVCSIDDFSDKYGSHSGAGITWCDPSVPSAPDDSQPEDFKRVTATVSWTTRGQAHNVKLTSLLAKNGAPDLPAINTLVLTTPSVATPSNPTISTSASSATFTATATTTAQTVQYSVDGVNMGNATLSGGNWTFTLSLAGWTDGAYTIGARALNAAGVPGPMRTLTLTLARSTPAAPSGLVGGRNSVTKNGSLTQVAELDWLPNAERNVLGYRVYRPGGTLACPGSASTFDLTSSCIDFAPVDGTYSVVALYRNASGTLLEGPASTVTVAPLLPPYTSYYFKNTTAYTFTNCATADGKRDADDSYAGSASDSTFSFASSIQTLNFCTRSLGAADAAAAGTTKVYAWATNSGGSSCTVTANVTLNGSTSAGSGTQTVPSNTSTPTPLTWSFPTTSYTFSSGDRIDVLFSTPNGASCNSTSIVYGGNVRRSRLDMPHGGGGQAPGTPSPPTGLTGTANADGSKTLNWTAPSGGNPVTYYRVYRDGVEYTSRYDTTGDTTTSYTDPNGDGLTHSYYVTAVGPTLAESSYVGPVTP
jgi:prepilin-type N-terminal cleavage/methylation domain-containing protein